ncbi:MAG TPA: anti-sigma factor [Acidimicrobiales bacterium]|jgi:anti-sigma factor RsiW|nr:anti-sigma factor [Acidimicrobiales bacterium]
MPELTHHQIEELLGAYALDALEPEEKAQVEAHLRECIRCVIEVGQHHEVTGLLANSGGDASDELWHKIAERLNPPSSVPSWDRLAARLEPVPDARTDPEEQSAAVIPLDQSRRRHRWMVRTASLVAAAAAVLAVVLGVQVDHLNHQVSALNSTGQSVSAAAQAALENPNTQRIQLTPPATSSGPKGTSVTLVVGSSGTGYVFASSLAPLPANQTYQLWGAISGQLVSLGVLGPDPNVRAFTYDTGTKVQAFAITAERGGGVVQTTHLPVVEAAVKQA